MQLFVALGLTAVILLAAASGSRTAAWSLTSPVLRHALRHRLASKTCWLGLALMLLITGAALWLLGVRTLDGASLFFGGMIFLFGGGTWFFLRLVLEDVRETFALSAGRWELSSPFELPAAPSEAPACFEAAERITCHDQRRCLAAPRVCGPGAVRIAWRPADWQRTGQPH